MPDEFAVDDWVRFIGHTRPDHGVITKIVSEGDPENRIGFDYALVRYPERRDAVYLTRLTHLQRADFDSSTYAPFTLPGEVEDDEYDCVVCGKPSGITRHPALCADHETVHAGQTAYLLPGEMADIFADGETEGWD